MSRKNRNGARRSYSPKTYGRDFLRPTPIERVIQEANRTPEPQSVSVSSRIACDDKCSYEYKRMNDSDHAAEYRLEAFGRCPGLTELWTQPFQAKYAAADGTVLIRFRSDANGDLQVATNIIEK